MSDLAFHALREYQPGDDRRYIHWRSSAKAGRLLVRQFLDTRRSHLSIVVDADPDLYAGGEGDVETGHLGRGLAGCCAAVMDEQDMTVVLPRPAGLPHDGLPDPRRPRPGAGRPRRHLRRLRRGAGPGAGHLDRLPRDGRAPPLHRDPACSRPVRDGGPQGRAHRRCEERVGVKHVAGLTLLTIGELEDLRAVLVGGLMT